MDALSKERYSKVKLGQIEDLMVEMLVANPMAMRVLIEIAKNDPEVQQNDNLKGVTKIEIKDSIELSDKKKSSPNPSRKVIDDAVSYLNGATLVYFEKNMKVKRWMLTSRGEDVLKRLLIDEFISAEDVINHKIENVEK